MFLDCCHYFLIYGICAACSEGRFSHLYSLMLTLCFFSTIACFMCSNCVVLSILTHSNVNTPLLYQISATWSNHEGSLLLWYWLLCFFGLWLRLFAQERQSYVKSLMVFFFGLFLCCTSNPFMKTQFVWFESLAELNPVLQDPVLAIHPACIYSGYVASAICFVLMVVVNVMDTNGCGWQNKWLNLRFWICLSWTTTTVGILLGSWWAYHELGWGGWWFWDPVENASLMPWLLATASVHSILFPRLNAWTRLLSQSIFLLSILGTVFVRSGLLASVHSFSQLELSTGSIMIQLCIVCFVVQLCKMCLITYMNSSGSVSFVKMVSNGT